MSLDALSNEISMQAEAEAKQRGYQELRLATHVALEDNVALYQHLGWIESGRDETRVYMTKAVG